jgi:ketosteroid isomerase-like protein
VPVHEPADINRTFAAAYNARDVDALIGLYEADAIVVNMDGSRSVGIDAIRHHLAELVQLGGSMTSTNLYAIEHSDVALVGAQWSVSFDDGREPVSGRSAEVLRRQPDALWKYIIDNPDSPAS